ncbi:LOW QUALITY PROTEIN: hypothetical protein Cgig2_027486 [Carnegiea gigantea]|uniref:Uncharacterized protein n=1 Tax=Carnegiea gigantea TaxID=171969 RepID=A0A9Q1KN20_9CARY|nr:LOW QUALITY PROTEIN: hypothetical protein Cgig2_027486 [Carnegiea gigantea]
MVPSTSMSLGFNLVLVKGPWSMALLTNRAGRAREKLCHLEKEVKKIAKKLKRLVVQVVLRRICLSFVIFLLSLLTRVRQRMGDARYEQFRDKGIELELESKTNELFRGGDIITPNIDPLPMPKQEDANMVYIPSQPRTTSTINQSFNIENNDIRAVGSMHDKSYDMMIPLSTPPVSQRVDGGGNGKDKRKLKNFALDPNNSAKTNGPRRMGSAAMMYEKLDIMLEVIISRKKVRNVEREERRVERPGRRQRRQRKEMNNKNASVDDGAPSVPNALTKMNYY